MQNWPSKFLQNLFQSFNFAFDLMSFHQLLLLKKNYKKILENIFQSLIGFINFNFLKKKIKNLDN